MDTFLKEKKINSVVFLLLLIISLFFVAKFVNEIKSSKYIGYNSQYINKISVAGKGEVKAVPDIATLTMNLKEEGKTSAEAQDLLNKSIIKVLGYLKKNIKEKDIKSEYGGLNPKYSYGQTRCIRYPCPPNDRKITGYIATQSIVVKIRKTDEANKIRTNLASLGVKNINGPTFTIDNNDVYKIQARTIAINKAKSKAKELAKELGVKLIRITSFSENNNNYPIMYRESAMADSSVKSFSAPELPKGENTVTSNVNITYEIR